MEPDGAGVDRRSDAPDFGATERLHYLKKVLIQLAGKSETARRRVDADKVDVRNGGVRLGDEANQECLQLACLVYGETRRIEVLEEQAREQ
jgi:hypothetical protein